MVRAAIITLLALPALLGLSACTRQVAVEPFAESRTPPDLGPRFMAPEGWAWGYVKVGSRPTQRYGVAGTSHAPSATVVIVPGYGETAETWFETVGDLNRRGYTVWVLDRAGQGGSGRYTLPRDLGHVPSFDADVAGLTALVRVVIRPSPASPVVLLSHADGAVVALRAAETGLRVGGVIASSPRIASTSTESARGLAQQFPFMDRLPSRGWRPWTRSAADDWKRGRTHDRWRGGVTHAWQTANPDLRLSGKSLGWRGAFTTASVAADLQAGAIKAPILMITPGPASQTLQALCGRAADCVIRPQTGAMASLHLESEAWRRPWMAAVSGFIENPKSATAKTADHAL